MPEITVFMPIYNGERYVSDAIQSILEQSYTNFELLIIDDGSTDFSVSEIKKFNDNRIRLVKNDENKGLPYTRNLGLKLSLGKFIAFMDSDDIAHKKRLEKQYNFLKSNKNIDIVSCRVNRVTKNYTLTEAKNDMDRKTIKKTMKKCYRELMAINKNPTVDISLLFSCKIANPGTMIRSDLVVTKGLRYREEFIVAQDYSFWIDCQKENARFYILNDTLLYYRTGHSNITNTSKKNNLYERNLLVNSIRERALRNNRFYLGKDQMELFLEINKEDNTSYYSRNIALTYKSLLTNMVDINFENRSFDHKFFKYMIQINWTNFIVKNMELNKKKKFKLLASNLFKNSLRSYIHIFIMLFR